ncbi:acetylornithine transaminase [Bacillaceae bacterium SIJ1]|uniref:acetylornithine transaminase n=1 Tax=Litoribacterium kuwaitense TaxID=1398745 RepID=UPI0013EC6893|nr:acetylornithine transaminase [Litoribacterium kuwaitense]NGP44551.1 acetylornithine transaminase [Litoribacterium kuwaitense]
MSHLFKTYGRWPIEIQAAEAATMTDTNEKTYVDLTSGLGVVNVGHCHPDVLAAVEKQLKQYWHTSNLFESSLQEKVATQLTENTELDLAFFCNSGAEANEGAIKLAKKHTGRTKIVTLQQSFHGRTFGAMAATGQDKIKAGFGPMLTEFVHIPLEDISALHEAVDDNTAAVMLEVIQGESGVRLASSAYLKAVEEACQNNGALLIIDEVQTGIGRTGSFFAYQSEGIDPDVVTVAKGLSNGLPVGAILGKHSLADAFSPGSHGTTFGGNPVAMAAASAVISIVKNDDFLQAVSSKGEAWIAQFKEELHDHPLVKDIRGKGLMIGIEMEKPVSPLITRLQEKGFLTLSAGENVLRLLPPLIISEDLLEDFVKTLKETMIAWHKETEQLV